MRDLRRAFILYERLRRKSKGEASAEEIIMRFRDSRCSVLHSWKN